MRGSIDESSEGSEKERERVLCVRQGQHAANGLHNILIDSVDCPGMAITVSSISI